MAAERLNIPVQAARVWHSTILQIPSATGPSAIVGMECRSSGIPRLRGLYLRGFDLMDVVDNTPSLSVYNSTPGRNLQASSGKPNYTKVTFYARASLSTDTVLKVEAVADGNPNDPDPCMTLSTSGSDNVCLTTANGASNTYAQSPQLLTTSWQKYTLTIPTVSLLASVKDLVRRHLYTVSPPVIHRLHSDHPMDKEELFTLIKFNTSNRFVNRCGFCLLAFCLIGTGLKAQDPGQSITAAGRLFPFYIYRGFHSRDNHFAPSGWMGDYGDVRFDDHWKLQGDTSGKTVIRIAYSAEAKQGAGWAGMYAESRQQLGQPSRRLQFKWSP